MAGGCRVEAWDEGRAMLRVVWADTRFKVVAKSSDMARYYTRDFTGSTTAWDTVDAR